MKILKIMIFILILIMSVGAVCASDISTDNQIIETSQKEVYATSEASFTNLTDEIENAGTSLTLTKDYTFNNATDNNLGILISKNNFILNGNGHTIDGKNQSRIFNITGNNITLTNLILINANADKGGAIFALNNITCNNVTFKYNYALTEGGSIYVSDHTNLTGCVFKSNYALRGTDVFFKRAQAPPEPHYARYSNIEDCTFKNTQNIQQASIYINYNIFAKINNCLFENMSGEYCPAIYSEYCGYFYILNSCFKNLYANKSGGSITFTSDVNGDIKNSTFTNCKSSKNGGAIYLDENGVGKGSPSGISIYEYDFINCSSEFGGAITQVGGGHLKIVDCNFTQNFATYNGGAICISYAMSLILVNSSFNNNKLIYSSEDGFFGAAVYALFTILSVNNSTFIDNSNNSIYTYGIDYTGKSTVVNSYFKNNGEAIRAVHIESLIFNNNTLNGDTISQFKDDEFLKIIISNPTIELKLINNTINVTNLPARFDSREWGWISSVKNQYESGACWCFATCAALESALLKATGVEYDFSEQNMQKMLLTYSKYGNKKMTEPGQTDIALQYILSWLGVIPEEYDTFDMYGKITKDYETPGNIHIQDAVILFANKTDINDYKKAIINYGAVTTDIAIGYKAPYFNVNTSASYYNETADKNTPNHAVTIVGWDDNYPKENFLITPPGNGAWIIKNSYGPEKYDKGYIYVSYYDTTAAKVSDGVAFSIENTEMYTRNYQTDFGGEIIYLSGNLSYKNSYSAVSSDLIGAIGTYFYDVGENYSFEIYVNDILKLNQNGNVTFSGFHTIKLEDKIPVKMGDTFTVIMTKNSVPLLNISRIYYKENTSFYNNGSGWIDTSLQNLTAVLKVYTVDLPIYTEDLVKIYKNDSQFVANISAANETVTFEINGKNYTRLSDENGDAVMAINLGPGNYTIKTTYNMNTVENTIIILPTLIAEDLVKYYRNASQFDITLINGAGKAVSGKNITMNINGVFYTRTTNENGTAKLNIILPPGEYILTAIDPVTGLQMSYTITVLPVLSASDITMKYLDGTQFVATVLDGEGNPYKEQTVSFNVNGIFYNRITGSNGQAKLNIRLIPGEYIITSNYNGANIANKITITPKDD